MQSLDELMLYVRRVGLMRKAQRRYQTRQADTTLASMRKLEAEVDELTQHYLDAPFAAPESVPFNAPLELPQVPPLLADVPELLDLPAPPAVTMPDAPAIAATSTSSPEESTPATGRRRRGRAEPNTDQP